MLPYCLKCRKNTESKYLKVGKTKNESIILLSNCIRFIKEQEASGLLSNLRINLPFINRVPIIGYYFTKV